MKIRKLLSFTLGIIVFSTGITAQTDKDLFEKYNIIWNEQSKNSSGSMPLNGHSIGCNVWVENGDLFMYVAQSGAFDENNESLKLGRFRISLSPNPFDETKSFKQELVLRDGYIKIVTQEGKSDELQIKLWTEVQRPVIHIEVVSEEKTSLQVSYESWRWRDVVIEPQEIEGVRSRRSSTFDYECYLKEMIKYGDSIYTTPQGLYFYHNNDTIFSAFDFVVKQQELSNRKNDMDNPLVHLISGGYMTGDNLKFQNTSKGEYYQTPFMAWNYASRKPQKQHALDIYTLVSQTSESEWKDEIRAMIAETKDKTLLFEDNTRWWHEFWNRSYIIINSLKNESDEAWCTGRNYNLFRYQLGGNAFGSMPTKFNGGNLTFDPGYISESFQYDPDFRRWGGGSFTAQNQRLVYWPMLKSGDFDAMLPQFEFYRKGLINAIIRSQVYWGHGGCSFTEQMQQSGLPIASHYGFTDSAYWIMKRPLDYEKGIQVNSYVQTLYQNQLEFAYMILQYYNYSKNSIEAYIPFIYNCIYFYDQHYQYRNMQNTGHKLNENGKLVLYPTTPSENTPNSTNAIDAISGLIAVVKSAIELPASLLSDEYRNYFSEVSKRIPEIELYTESIDGNDVVCFRESTTDLAWHPGTIPSLYPVYPYNLVNPDMPEFEYAQNTWKYKISDGHKVNYASWRPGAIFGARFGETEYAGQQILKKLGNSQRRYPTFWGPGHDWVPDHNWGGSGMIGLQEMLIQEYNGKIHILPAWPEEWDVKFKLYASDNTSVEVDFKNGRIESLIVFPEDRLKDVVADVGAGSSMLTFMLSKYAKRICAIEPIP